MVHLIINEQTYVVEQRLKLRVDVTMNILFIYYKTLDNILYQSS